MVGAPELVALEIRGDGGVAVFRDQRTEPHHVAHGGGTVGCAMVRQPAAAPLPRRRRPPRRLAGVVDGQLVGQGEGRPGEDLPGVFAGRNGPAGVVPQIPGLTRVPGLPLDLGGKPADEFLAVAIVDMRRGEAVVGHLVADAKRRRRLVLKVGRFRRHGRVHDRLREKARKHGEHAFAASVEHAGSPHGTVTLLAVGRIHGVSGSMPATAS